VEQALLEAAAKNEHVLKEAGEGSPGEAARKMQLEESEKK
jgi:hypothetical protein